MKLGTVVTWDEGLPYDKLHVLLIILSRDVR